MGRTIKGLHGDLPKKDFDKALINKMVVTKQSMMRIEFVIDQGRAYDSDHK